MSGPNGGERPGAGRKPRAVKFAGPIAAAEEKVSDRLPKLVESLIDQAMGWTIVEPEEEWIPSALVTVKGPLRTPNGSIWLDDKGKPAIVDLPVFPNLKPDQLVLVRRKTLRVLPDFRAAAYLVDRIMSKVGTEPETPPEVVDLRAALVAAHAAFAARKAAKPAAPVPTEAADGA